MQLNLEQMANIQFPAVQAEGEGWEFRKASLTHRRPISPPPPPPRPRCVLLLTVSIRYCFTFC